MAKLILLRGENRLTEAVFRRRMILTSDPAFNLHNGNRAHGAAQRSGYCLTTVRSIFVKNEG